MNICEIAFSTDWFLTIPGILITCGVILLIIALIMLLVSSTKGKKSESSLPQATVEPSNVMNPSVPTGMGIGITPVPDLNLDSANLGTDMNAVPNMGVPVMDSVPTVDTPSTDVGSISLDSAPSGLSSIPTLEPIAEMEIPTGLPTVDPVQPVITLKEDEVVPTLESLGSIPSIEETPTDSPEPVSMPSVSQTENMNAFDALTNSENTNAYGGAPIIPELQPVQEEARPIYGGANPLESTQNIPVIEEHHEPYGGALNATENTSADTSTIGPVPVLETAARENEVSETASIPTDSVATPNSDVSVLDTEPVKVEESNISEPVVPEVPVVENGSLVDPIMENPEPVEATKVFIPKLDDSSVEVEEL